MPDVDIALDTGVQALFTAVEEAILYTKDSCRDAVTQDCELHKVPDATAVLPEQHDVPDASQREWPFLKKKFSRKRMPHVAIDAIVKRIVPTVSMKTCMASKDTRPFRRKSFAEACNGGLHGQVLDEQTLLAVALDAFVCQRPCLYVRQEAAEEGKREGGDGDHVEYNTKYGNRSYQDIDAAQERASRSGTYPGFQKAVA